MCDLISRQSAIDIVSGYAEQFNGFIGSPNDSEVYAYARGLLLSIEMNINAVPSAQPEQTGGQTMYDELIKRLREHNGWALNETLDDAADAIEKLSRRETPMRVRTTTSTKRCPSCNKQLSGIGNIHRDYRFCRWCGQALDWTEPPKEE